MTKINMSLQAALMYVERMGYKLISSYGLSKSNYINIETLLKVIDKNDWYLTYRIDHDWLLVVRDGVPPAIINCDNEKIQFFCWKELPKYAAIKRNRTYGH